MMNFFYMACTDAQKPEFRFNEFIHVKGYRYKLLASICRNLRIHDRCLNSQAEPREHYLPTGVTSLRAWRDSAPTGNCGGNTPLCNPPRVSAMQEEEFQF